jgi:4a-hydroxytetrahydrobiopterin dehydratase
MPILLEGANMPSSSQLPESLRKILSLQGVQLRTQSWDQDLRNLCETLSNRFGVQVKDSSQFLPTPDELKSEVGKISDQGLARFKGDGRLPGWAVETVYDFKESGAVREFLKKTYRFKNDAVAFKFIAKIQSLTKKHKHHPIIEAKYADVSIRLSTWDAGHYITKYDVELAMSLDKTAKPLPLRS